MNIYIRLNKNLYTSLEELESFAHKEVVTFLKEWFNTEAYVIGHTSGSTGKPKEIRLLKKDMQESAQITNTYFHIGQDTRILLCLSPTYIAGKMMIVRALLAKANLWVTSPSSSPLSLVSEQVDFAAMVPMQVETTLNTPETKERFNTIKQVIIGGAATSPLLKQKLQNLSTECFGTYGMTETVSHVALCILNGTNASTDYFALGETRFSTDKRGCLVLHTPHLHTQEFVTNDIVRLIDDRHFEWSGRYDHVINSGGIKLFPETLEQKIAHSISRRFFITSLPDRHLGEKVILVIEDIPWSENRCKELREKLNGILSSYEIPKEIQFLPRFKETYSGKIIREL